MLVRVRDCHVVRDRRVEHGLAVAAVDRGGVKLTPTADLAPGNYAIVIRPVSHRKLAGPEVLGNTGEGRVFSIAWDFVIK